MRREVRSISDSKLFKTMASSSSPASQNSESGSELIDAIKSDNVDLVELLLNKAKAKSKVNSLSNEKRAPMFYAVQNSNVRVMKLLLAKGANFKKDTESLSFAVAESSAEIIKILLQNGADPNIRSKGGAWGGRGKSLAPFNKISRRDSYDDDDDYGYGYGGCDCGPDFAPSLRGYDRQKMGRTPLHLAADIGREEAASLLIEYGADVDCKTRKGLTPLIVAAYKTNLGIVKILLESNAAVDLADSYKATAFHAAAKCRTAVVLETLVEFCFHDLQLILKTGICQMPALRFSSYSNRSQLENCGRLTIIVAHWLKMLVAGLITREEQEALLEMTASNQRLRNSIEKNEKYKAACTLEVAQLKCEMMGNSGFPYFAVLTKHENRLVFLAKNEVIAKTLNSASLEAKFQIYSNVLRSQFHKGQIRKKLLQRGVEVGQFLFGIQLPDLVMEKILKFLDNKTIKVFITAST